MQASKDGMWYSAGPGLIMERDGKIKRMMIGEASVADWLDNEDLEESVKPLKPEMLSLSSTQSMLWRMQDSIVQPLRRTAPSGTPNQKNEEQHTSSYIHAPTLWLLLALAAWFVCTPHTTWHVVPRSPRPSSSFPTFRC